MKIKVDPEKCNGCGLCEDFCLRSVYKLNEKTKKVERIRKENCVHCFLCVEKCPKKAISIVVD